MSIPRHRPLTTATHRRLSLLSNKPSSRDGDVDVVQVVRHAQAVVAAAVGAALVASYKPIKIEVKVAKHFEPAGKMKVVVVGGLFVAVAAVILFSDRGGSKKRQKGYQSVTPGAEMFSRRKK